MRTKKIEWPVKARKEINQGIRRINRDGEPNSRPLYRYGNDHALRTVIDTQCCDCGLRHLYIFEVVRDSNGQWWLIKRSHRIDVDKPKRKKR